MKPEAAARSPTTPGVLLDAEWQPPALAPDGSAVVSSAGTDASVTCWWLPLDGTPASVIAEDEFGFADVQRLAP